MASHIGPPTVEYAHSNITVPSQALQALERQADPRVTLAEYLRSHGEVSTTVKSLLLTIAEGLAFRRTDSLPSDVQDVVRQLLVGTRPELYARGFEERFQATSEGNAFAPQGDDGFEQALAAPLHVSTWAAVARTVDEDAGARTELLPRTRALFDHT